MYILNFIIITILLVLAGSQKKNEKDFKWLLPVIFIQLLYIKCFVDINTVSDLDSYKDHFLEVRYLGWIEILKTKAEFGYYIIAKICYSVSQSFQFFLFVYNSIMLSLFFVWIKRESVNVELSVVLFLLLAYSGSIYILRQYMAIAILLLSYRYILERKLIKYLLVVVIAISFHRTAVIFLPLYFIFNQKNKYAIVLAIVSFGVIAFWAVQNPYLFVENLTANENYMKYLDKEEYSGTIMVALVNMTFLAAYIFIIGKKILHDDVSRLFFIMLTIATIVSFWGVGFPLVGRLVKYYDIVLIVTIPFMAKNIKSLSVRYAFVAIVCLLEFYIAFLSSSAKDYVDMKVPTIFDISFI
jgi:hypothetical protein